ICGTISNVIRAFRIKLRIKTGQPDRITRLITAIEVSGNTHIRVPAVFIHFPRDVNILLCGWHVECRYVLHRQIGVKFNDWTILFPPFGGNQHHSIGGPATVYRCCGCILEYRNRFNVVRINEIKNIRWSPERTGADNVFISVPRGFEYLAIHHIQWLRSPIPSTDASHENLWGLVGVSTYGSNPDPGCVPL